MSQYIFYVQSLLKHQILRSKFSHFSICSLFLLDVIHVSVTCDCSKVESLQKLVQIHKLQTIGYMTGYRPQIPPLLSDPCIIMKVKVSVISTPFYSYLLSTLEGTCSGQELNRIHSYFLIRNVRKSQH